MENEADKTLTIVITGTSHYSDAVDYAMKRLMEACPSAVVVTEPHFEFKMSEPKLPILYIPRDLLAEKAMRELDGRPKRMPAASEYSDLAQALERIRKVVEPLDFEREVLQMPIKSDIAEYSVPVARYFEKPDRIPVPASYKRNRFPGRKF